MSNSLVTLTAYHRPSDAGVAQGALSDAGIPSEIDAAERVRLKVNNLDAIRAGDVLERNCATLEEIAEADEETSEPAACVACGSPDIGRSSRGVMFGGVLAIALGIGAATGLTDVAFLAVLVSGVYYLISGRFRCSECGASWN